MPALTDSRFTLPSIHYIFAQNLIGIFSASSRGGADLSMRPPLVCLKGKPSFLDQRVWRVAAIAALPR